VSKNPFIPLRHRAVRLLWGAAVISDIGTWVQLIVVGSLVAAHTGSAVQTGLVALATFMPQGIASPVGGILADRYDRRKVFATALMAQAAATTALAVVLGAGVRTPAVLTALILVGSAAGSTGAPAYSAMQPDLVPPDELMAMVSLGVYSWNGGRIVGPMLGTLLALWWGPAWTVGFNAATFVVMAVAVTLVRRPFVPHGAVESDRSVLTRLKSGYQALRVTPGCLHGVVLLVIFNLTVVPFMGLIPIYVRSGFHGGTGLAGMVASAQGVGAIVGGLFVTMLATRHPRSSIVSGLIVVLPLALIAYAVVPNSTLLVPAAALLGGSSASMFITVSAIIQRDAPSISRGRILAIQQAAMGTSYGLGLLAIGAIGDLSSLRVAFSVGAVLLIVFFGALTIRSRHWRAALNGALRPA
jgi:MFS family permease